MEWEIFIALIKNDSLMAQVLDELTDTAPSINQQSFNIS